MMNKISEVNIDNEVHFDTTIRRIKIGSKSQIIWDLFVPKAKESPPLGSLEIGTMSHEVDAELSNRNSAKMKIKHEIGDEMELNSNASEPEMRLVMSK